MDHILNIQETIDENRGAIPTGVVYEPVYYLDCTSLYPAMGYAHLMPYGRVSIVNVEPLLKRARE